MKRSKFGLSHYKIFSCNMGDLVPVGCYEVIPGDTIQQSTSLLVRLSPLQAPVMHPSEVRIHHWFVPHRIAWAGWEDFITGGADGEGGSSGTYPTITSGVAGFTEKSLQDYLGVNPNTAGGNTMTVSNLPAISYAMIWNEYYRDQDLQSLLDVTPTSQNNNLSQCSWSKDYFTTARPWPMKGPEVTIPVQGNLVVQSTTAIGGDTGKTLTAAATLQGDGASTRFTNATDGDFFLTGRSGASGSTAFTAIDDIRRAGALLRYQEARAQYGSRYVEYLRYLGIRPSDARLQRPEFLGGGRATISFSEVLQTAPIADTGTSEDTGVGDLFGHGISAVRSRKFRKFFEEHGLVISLMSVRPKSVYNEATHKMFWRRTREDYFQKELQFIGQQEVLKRELYADGSTTDDDVFGYQDRYAEYKHIPSLTAGDFRSVLNYWHMARSFSSVPTLNSSFVSCVPTDRIYTDQDPNNADHLWCMAQNSVQARRMMAKNPTGRIF